MSAASGFEYFRGDYGELDLSESMAVPISLSLAWGAFALGAVLPVQRAEVDSVTCTGANAFTQAICRNNPDAALGAGLATLESQQTWGVGDLALDGSATWLPTTSPLWVPGVSGFVGVKLPTGDVDDSLGTGSVDTTLGLDVSWLVLDVFVPFATAGYTFVDDREDLGLEDFAFASVGLAWAPLPMAGVTLALDWRDRAAVGEDDALQLSPSLWLRLGDHWSFEPFGVVGLSESAPDFGVGTRIRVTY